VERREGDIAGTHAVWHDAGSGAAAEPGGTPILYVHGVPNAGRMWRPFLERSGGIAPDLPGFGESDKSAGFDYSIAGYGDWLEAFVDQLGLTRFSLVMHDWGAVGLELAQRRPEAVERLVLIDLVPFLPGYSWHRTARIWRTPVVGELFMGSGTKWMTKRWLRMEKALRPEHVDGFVDEVWEHFDHGTQRAILKLYRSAPPPVLERAGDRLGAITAPSLILWGEDDRFLANRFAHDYARALGGAVQVEVVPGAVHWVWLERPELVDRVVGFLSGD
jgi:pimeloyl-ACP methyl ester carboxylesterase